MSLAEEMLATMSASDDSSTYLAEEEPHIIIDNSRTAFVPPLLKTIAVTGDHKVEKITFDCVRFWDGNDLSTFAIYLNYVLPDFSTGTYIPSSIVADNNVFHFDWEIKNNITKKSGRIAFSVTAVKTKTNEEGQTVVDKQWSSLPNWDCSIALGLNIANVPDDEETQNIIAEMSAILEQMQLDIDEWIENVVVQSTGDSETAVMSQKAVTDETQNICLTQIKGIEAVGNMLPNYAEKVAQGCYCHIVEGKVSLSDNENYTAYKFRVTPGTYYFNWSRWVVVTDAYGNALNEVPSEDIISIDVSAYPNAAYVWYATVSPQYFSKYLPNMLQAYKNNLVNEHEVFTYKDEVFTPTLDSNWFTSLQKGLVVSASMTIDNIDDFVGVQIRFVGEDNTDSVKIRILKTYIEVTDFTFGNPVSTIKDHGLTIANNLQILVRYIGNSNVYLDVVSNGVKYSMNAYSIKVGRSRPVLSVSGIASNVHFSAVCEDINKKIWGFGDSYFSYDSSRWVYYLLTGNYKDNMLINAYSGANSVAAFNDLKTLIKNGTPKYIFWCLGMNDGSDTDENTPSAQWAWHIYQVIELCRGMNITPILATIPTVPSVYNEAKNKWVRESGYQYVDFAKAVGASSTGTWYNGMLSSDGVHPDTQGGVALYHQVLADFPQIMIT